MIPACWPVWVGAILPGLREWFLLLGLAVVLFGRSPRLRRRTVRWLRPWREGQGPRHLGPLVVVALVSAAITALLMTWFHQGLRPLP